MTEDKIIKELSEIVNNFQLFKEIAENIEWIDIEEYHRDWFKTYPLGITVDVCCFPEGYVEKHFKESYVRCILSSMAYFEEWDKDFWDIPKEERTYCLTNKATKGNINLYETYTTYKDLRLKPVSSDFLSKEVRYFAGENKIEYKEQEAFLKYAENAVIIEIGGCYAGDYSYISVQGDNIFMVDCGVWD